MGSNRFGIRSELAEQNREASTERPAFPGRRSFFAVLIAVGTAMMAALWGIPLVRFTIYPLLTKTTQTAWSNLGSLGEYSALSEPVRRIVKITKVDGWRQIITKKPVYITRGTRPGSENGIEVLSSICPHLGCEVPWNKARGQFVCPCHNSVFAPDGSRISGPSPRGMDTLPIKKENGELMARYEYFRQLTPEKEVVG